MERYQQIFFKNDDQLILPGESFSFDFDFRPEEFSEYRLFFTGEVDNFYWWKSEPCCSLIYKRINESLVHGKYGAYGLKFTGADYPMLACHKITWKPTVCYLGLTGNTEHWTCGVKASAKDVRIKEGGYLRLTLEIRHVRPGVMKKQTKFKPDEIVTIDFPEGTYEGKDFTTELVLPDQSTANVQYILEGEKFEGEIVFECPHFTSSNGFNVLTPFGFDSSRYQERFNWFGVNLSKTEWPKMRILVNENEIFADEFFERCHRYSEKEITFDPSYLKEGKNTVEMRLISDCFEPLPYRLHEVGIVREDRHSFDVVSCPEIAVAGKEFALLLDLSDPCTLTVDTEAKILSSLVFSEAGLQVLRLVYPECCNNLPITLSDGITTHIVYVNRVIEREEDGVITGTGDHIYVNHNMVDSMNFFKWYTQNHIGNLFTIRPTYRWSGARVRNDAMWQKLVAIMNAMGMKYSHMLDGREPQGFNVNPSLSKLSADTAAPSGFLGRQLHERDGAYCYWGDYFKNINGKDNNNFYDTEQYYDMIHRIRHNDPDHSGCLYYPEDFFDDGNRYWLCHDPSLPIDMEIQAKAVMNSLSSIRKSSTRHTGPSIFFKYFCQSGFSWIGAETMDSPTEFLLGALRGAAEAYHVPTTGVHHALQWSSSPHEDPLRYRRYRLALYVSWMQGAKEHNTEEGLWHMEEYFEHHHRHSKAAKAHLAVQQDFFRLVSSHSRIGRVRSKVAALHGKYDGYPCFGAYCVNVWGRGPHFGVNGNFDDNSSWHIARNVFYPNGKNWSCFTHNCKEGPIGLASPNALGSLNIVPVEEEWGDYSLLAFFGYNKAEAAENDRILRRVKEGSTLLLTLAHLTCTTDRKAIQAYELLFEDHPIFTHMGFDGVPRFSQATYGGKEIPVGENLCVEESEIIVKTDDGRPLIVEKQCGKGKIVFFNTMYYPGNSVISDAYQAEFQARSAAVAANENLFPVVGEDVQAVVYDLPDATQAVYMIAIDWWNMEKGDRTLQLRINGIHYPLSLPFGVMKKALVKDGVAVVCQSETADILRFTENGFVVQGVGKEEFLLLKDGNITSLTADFTEKPQIELEL